MKTLDKCVVAVLLFRRKIVAQIFGKILFDHTVSFLGAFLTKAKERDCTLKSKCRICHAFLACGFLSRCIAEPLASTKQVVTDFKW